MPEVVLKDIYPDRFLFRFFFFSLLAALSYGIASMAMVFINKAILMQYTYSMTLLTLQVLFS